MQDFLHRQFLHIPPGTTAPRYKQPANQTVLGLAGEKTIAPKRKVRRGWGKRFSLPIPP